MEKNIKESFTNLVLSGLCALVWLIVLAVGCTVGVTYTLIFAIWSACAACSIINFVMRLRKYREEFCDE